MNPDKIVKFVRDLYKSKDFIPLHAPKFFGNEKNFVNQTLESTYVSSIGNFVADFERSIESFTGSSRAVAAVNGTAGLGVALNIAGVGHNDLVITQALSFVATANAIYHSGAKPIFIDVSETSMGLCPKSVASYLEEFADIDENGVFLKSTHQRIKAIVPMHTFGHPVELDELNDICKKWKLCLIEDAAESLGSFYKGKHTGTIGTLGVISFNGNKIITTGGGGMVLCDTEAIGAQVKHLTTQAKVPHEYEFIHDQPGFNYRLPNINAALGCAQMEMLEVFLNKKRKIAEEYRNFFSNTDIQFFEEPSYSKSNYWLNAVICPSKESRDELLKETNKAEVMTRPIWKLLHKLPMYSDALRDELTVSKQFEKLVINLPSSLTDI